MSVLDSKLPLSNGVHCMWKAHDNAIFDIAWSYDDSYLITGSGDQACIVWDTETLDHLAVFQSHSSSVKSVDAHPFNKSDLTLLLIIRSFFKCWARRCYLQIGYATKIFSDCTITRSFTAE